MPQREAPVDPSGQVYTGTGVQNAARSLIAQLTDVPEHLTETVDDNVYAELPGGSIVKKIYSHGQAYWTRTAAIHTEQANGSPLSFFVKVTVTDAGADNLRGEFISMKLIDAAVPRFCPRPIAIGNLARDSNAHFYLQEFVDMTDEPGDLDTLPQKLAELHRIALSPNGKFGFEVPTNHGPVVVKNEWTGSWELSFTRIMEALFAFELQMHGRDEEMERLSKDTIEKIIPRLLRPLETGGRSLTPRLVHGDLWDGNTSMNVNTDEPVIFDGSSLYAHNEYELGAWNQPRHQIYRAHIREYQKHFPISEPEEDVEDRLLLYRIRFNLVSSNCYLNNQRYRILAKEDMQTLLQKYPGGYEGPEARKAD